MTKTLYVIIKSQCYNNGHEIQIISTTTLYSGYDKFEAMRIYYAANVTDGLNVAGRYFDRTVRKRKLITGEIAC